MQKIIKLIKNNILGFIIGAILFGGIGIALAVQSNIASSDIAYTNSKNANVTSVKQAVDDLYSKLGDGKTCGILDKLGIPIIKVTCIDSDYLFCQVIMQYKKNDAEYGVYYHNGTITGTTAGIDTTTEILDAEDLSFRYSGTSNNINNYVCFGSTATTCPSGNLYRIIGAFTFDNGETYHTKLIKNISYGSYAWDKTSGGYGSNTWMRPSDIRKTLNNAYLTSIGDTWSNLIYQPIWKVGGNNTVDANAKSIFDVEMASLGGAYKPTTGDIDANGAYVDNEAKVGLMYVSDYGYAASPKYWKTNLSSYQDAAKSYDWLVYTEYQWTISRGANNGSYSVCTIYDSGWVTCGNSANGTNAIRPTFYLNSNVEVSSGTGTSSDPWRIKLS